MNGVSAASLRIYARHKRATFKDEPCTCSFCEDIRENVKDAALLELEVKADRA